MGDSLLVFLKNLKIKFYQVAMIIQMLHRRRKKTPMEKVFVIIQVIKSDEQKENRKNKSLIIYHSLMAFT